MLQDLTGMTLFVIMIDRESVLSVELDVSTWQTLPWDHVADRGELLALRARQIKCWDENVTEAMLWIEQKQDRNQKAYNEQHNIWSHDIKEEDLILLYNSKLKISFTDKLVFQWLGSYRVHQILANDSYFLQKLDDMPFSQPVHDNQIKHFFIIGDNREDAFLAHPQSDEPEQPIHPTHHQSDIERTNGARHPQDYISRERTFAILISSSDTTQ